MKSNFKDYRISALLPNNGDMFFGTYPCHYCLAFKPQAITDRMKLELVVTLSAQQANVVGRGSK